MPTDALRRLLRLHLVVAHHLQLLEEVSLDELDQFIAIPGDWGNASFTPLNRFERAVQRAGFALERSWRYRCCQLGSDLLLARVVRLADLAYALDATGPRSKVEFKRAASVFGLLKADFAREFTSPDSTSAIGQVASVMVDLRAEIVSHRSSPFRVPLQGIHAPGSCWVAQPAAVMVSAKAQWYRDRLGLHHYPRANTVGDQLVLLEFRAQLSNTPCPPRADPTLRDRMPEGLWLLRPTVVDKPNARFAQGHEADDAAAAAHGGATIDIGSDAYLEGETELILLAGRDAQVQWHDLQLLPGGPPARHARDDDHPGFSDTMHHRLTRFA